MYDRVASAVDRMLYEDFVDNGLAVILRKQLVLGTGVPIHVSRLSWTAKVGKAKGRPITDCSAGVLPLNSDFTKFESDALWGPIQHPTVSDLANMVLQFQCLHGIDWSELVLWKVDLRGAYTLLSFKPEEIPFLGAEIRGDLLIFFLCGIFG